MQYLRDNAGFLEASSDGNTWEVVSLGEGGGGVSDHTLLTNIGTQTHAQLDSHVADTGIHGGGAGGFSGAFTIVTVDANKSMTLGELDASLLVSDGAASRFVGLPDTGITQGQTAHFLVQGVELLSLYDGASNNLRDPDLGNNCQAIYSTTDGSAITLIYIGSTWQTLRKLGTWAAQYPE